ncbi:hypothetical protein Gogos_013178, partial [Gossypium gossypioides]|nr:hypothetical protein [Gossypium gossypioides]
MYPHFGEFIKSKSLQDRVIGNEAWCQSFPHCLVTHLTQIKSDHSLLLVNITPNFKLPRGRPFRFLAGWTQRQDFPNIVKNSWNYSGDMFSSLNQLTAGLKVWNKNVYGHIGFRKQKLMKSLSSIQMKLERSYSYSLAQKEMNIREELENVLSYEELLWKQISRCGWLKLEDRNTKFFHNRVMYKRNINRITALRNINGDWLYDPEDIQEEAINYFQKLYGERPSRLEKLPPSRFPPLENSDIDFLQ